MFTQPQPNVSCLNHTSTLFQCLSIECIFYSTVKQTTLKRWPAYARAVNCTSVAVSLAVLVADRIVRAHQDRMLEVDLDLLLGQFLLWLLLDIGLRARG